MPPDSNEEPEIINGPEEQEKKKPERIIPEFVYLDDGPEDEKLRMGATPQDPRQMFGSIETMAQGRHPFYLRVLSLFGTFIMLAFALVVFVVMIVALSLSLLLLRQSSTVNQQAFAAWRWFKKLIVFALGSFVSIFNFSLGIGIVLMYFMLTGQKMNSRFMQEFTKFQK